MDIIRGKHNRGKRTMKQGENLKIGHYILKESLGKGSFGSVLAAEHDITQDKVAVKIMSRNIIKRFDVVSKIKREIMNMKRFRHPHIVRLYDVFTTPTDIYMVMECASGGEVFDYIVKETRLTEWMSRRFFQQLISGVKYCHDHGIVHRDLKPENLLLDGNLNLKIADFGLSNTLRDGHFLKTSCGSPNYAPPEIISGNLYAGPEVDIWSCGIILYTFLCGKLPFDHENVTILFKKIRAGNFHIPYYLSKGAVELLQKLIVVDSVKRAKIIDIRETEWFQMDLPPHLFPKENSSFHSTIESGAIEELCAKFKVTKKQAMLALTSMNPYNELVVGYNLILDKRRNEQNDKQTIVKIDDFYVASLMGDREKGSVSQLKHPERMPDNTVTHTLQQLTRTHQISKDQLAQQQSIDVSTQSVDQPEPERVKSNRAKWHLGIRSQSKPADILYEIFRTMKQLGFVYHVCSRDPWRILVKKRDCSVDFNTDETSNENVALILQLYRIEYSYLLDFIANWPSEFEAWQQDPVDTAIDSQFDRNHANIPKLKNCPADGDGAILGHQIPHSQISAINLLQTEELLNSQSHHHSSSNFGSQETSPNHLSTTTNITTTTTTTNGNNGRRRSLSLVPNWAAVAKMSDTQKQHLRDKYALPLPPRYDVMDFLELCATFICVLSQ
ncbi:hypothetical protein SNEBB_008526 [Seison nebaliae]|nr:hypothetical protein SNEBB_008526 [Seison nebaliae]